MRLRRWVGLVSGCRCCEGGAEEGYCGDGVVGEHRDGVWIDVIDSEEGQNQWNRAKFEGSGILCCSWMEGWR